MRELTPEERKRIVAAREACLRDMEEHPLEAWSTYTAILAEMKLVPVLDGFRPAVDQMPPGEPTCTLE
jgi:hypothetical protein